MKYLIILSLLFLSSCDFPKVVSGSFSKEFCSCYFLVGRSEKQCYEFALQIIKISEYKIDKENKTVWSKGLGRETVAKYISPRFGCQITQQK